MESTFLAFLGISALVIAMPGPDTALTIRNTFLGGRRAGTFTALGVAVGQLVWVAGTSAGLVAVLLASEALFRFIKLLGAAYLLLLGIQSLVSAVRRTSAPAPKPAAGARSEIAGGRAFRQGVINNLANPKMAVFFASVLPQFAPKGQGMLSTLALLGLVFATLTFAWLALYAAVIARAGAFVRGSRLRRAIDGVAGAALIGLGIKVATEER
jgi:threonine/homoserine/homoserine lactone efflux protein